MRLGRSENEASSDRSEPVPPAEPAPTSGHPRSTGGGGPVQGPTDESWRLIRRDWGTNYEARRAKRWPLRNKGERMKMTDAAELMVAERAWLRAHGETWLGRADESCWPDVVSILTCVACRGRLKWCATCAESPSAQRSGAMRPTARPRASSLSERRKAAAESVRAKTGIVVALIPNTAPPGASGDATKSAIEGACDGVRDQGGTVVALIPNAAPPGAPREPGEATKGIELPGDTVPRRRWRVVDDVLECTAMGGWRQVLPGVPLRTALVWLGFSPDSATSLPRVAFPVAQDVARWVDRWGFIHRTLVGSRVPLSHATPSVELREAA